MTTVALVTWSSMHSSEEEQRRLRGDQSNSRMENMPRIQKRILSVKRLREGADVARLAIIGRHV